MAGLAATFVDVDTFTVLDDLTASFIPGRRVKLDCDTDGIKYGTVLNSSFSSITTVNLTAQSDNITVNLIECWFGILGADDNTQSMPDHNHDGAEASGGKIAEISAGDSGVTVTDAGTGTVDIDVDGNPEVDITDAGVRLGGADARVNSIKDEDDMSSDLATALTTQQSQKAFVEIGNAAIEQVITSTANAVAWDMNNGRSAVHTLTENTTISAPSNLKAGVTYNLRVVQAAGVYSLAFNAVFEWGVPAASAAPAADGDVIIITGYSDGTSIYVLELNRTEA